MDLITINEVLENEDLNKSAEEVQDLKRAAEIIKRYGDIIKTKKKCIINVAYYQGQVLKKFKGKEKFTELVNELGIHKNTIRKLLKGWTFLRIIKRTLKQFVKNMKKIFNVERLSFKTRLLVYKSLLEI